MSTEGLQIAASPYGPGWVRLRVRGELDIATARPFGERLIEEVDSAPGVLLDLANVEFIDSTGLALLMAGVRHAESAGHPLEIAQPLPAQPQRLLELSGLLPQLTLHAA